MLAPSSLNVNELFRIHRTYRAPLYQRAYVWNLLEHWEPLWEDIRSAAERVGSFADARTVPHEHFLGAIVVQNEIVSPERNASSSIIDGQQRLTTLQIILCALRNLARAFDEIDEAAKIHQLIENPGQDASGDRWKVWPTNIDRKQFAAVTGGGVQGTIGLQTSIIGACRFFFKAFTDFCIIDTRGSTTRERLASLSIAIQHRLRVVLITLGPVDDPHMIFEALNARGTPLLASDLVKNHVFASVRDARMSPDVIYDKFWNYFTERTSVRHPHFWQDITRVGRFQVSWLDLYISTYLMMRLAREVSQSRLFAEFRGWWATDLDRREIEARLTSISEHAKIFVALLDADDEDGKPPARKWAFKVGGLAAMPLLLAIASREIGLTIDGERDAALRVVESYIVRRLVCGLPNTGHARFFLELLERAKHESPISSEWLQIRLAADLAPSRRWPDDVEFQRSWLEAPIYRELSPKALKAILIALDTEMLNKNNEYILLDDGNLEIEHILPQKWREVDYPLPETSHKEAARRFEEERERRIHSFGNLTLLVSSLNKEVSNGAFSQKRIQIAAQSVLRLNVYFQRFTDVTKWDSPAIEARGREMFNSAIQLWPHPGVENRVADIRDTLFLPRTSILNVLKVVRVAKQSNLSVNEISRITGNQRVADLKRLGLISDERVVVPSTLSLMSTESCIITLAEQQETIIFAQSILEHNPNLRGIELGEHLASHYATRWTATSVDNYGSHLLTWVRWIARQKIIEQAKAGELDVKRLVDNPDYWVTNDTVKRGSIQTLNELGWKAASEVWNDLTHSVAQATVIIGLNAVSIRRQLKSRGILSLRDDVRLKQMEERGVARKERRHRPSWDRSITMEEEQELLRMWRDRTYDTGKIVSRSGFLAGSLYHRFGPRPKKS